MAETAVETPVDAQVEAAAQRELLCPICMQMIKDAFLTACGHSFCYMCIVTHLQNKNDCPCCAHFLTTSQLFPNFLLDKLLKKTFAHQLLKSASPLEQLRQSLEQGCEVTIKELDTLLALVSEKKRVMEQEEAERNMQFLLDFLHCLRKQKVSELNEVQHDLQYIKDDINAVERHRIELYRARDRYSGNLQIISYEPMETRSQASSVDRNTSSIVSNSCDAKGVITSVNFKNKKEAKKAHVNPLGTQSKDASFSGPTSQHISQSGMAVLRKKRVHAQFNDLQEFYLQTRRQSGNQLLNQVKKDKSKFNREGYTVGLVDFQSVLSTFTRYSRLRVIAELRHEDLFHHANIVSSIEFDRDDELFATAGVSRCIKIFDFSSVVNETTDVHCPVVEMSTRSKLSCLTWNKFTKNHIASSDYEGIVTVWDVTTRQSIMEYEEHEKRAWSVDFSRTEPSMLVSGSDDCKVKVWCTKQEACVLNIDMKANICCVKYSPESSKFVADLLLQLDGTLDLLSELREVDNLSVVNPFIEKAPCFSTSASASAIHWLIAVCVADNGFIGISDFVGAAAELDGTGIGLGVAGRVTKVVLCFFAAGAIRAAGAVFSFVPRVLVGSADHHIHYYDLRNTCHPLHIFSGHKKTVSHVKFLSNNELASASTDNTLRLWDVKNNVHVRAFRGHTNEKNFVGLTGNNEFLACGSETNEVFVYHKAISKPATWHRFGSPDLDENDEDAGSYFISAVCWKSESPTMLAANSKGTIKVLVLAA